jgi:AcrR family transcriptional regulator
LTAEALNVNLLSSQLITDGIRPAIFRYRPWSRSERAAGVFPPAAIEALEAMRPTRKPMKQSDRSEMTQNRILDAATRLFARHGYERTSTTAIAREAGVSQGIIFHYFETKEKLFWAIVFKGAAEQKKIFEKVIKQTDPVEKLRLSGKIMAQIAEEYPDLNEILARHTILMDLTPEKVKSHGLLKMLELHEEIIDEGKAARTFRKEIDTQTAAITLVGIFCINYLKWNALGRKGSLQDMVQKAFDMFLSGILTKRQTKK